MVGTSDSALLLALLCWVWGICGEEVRIEVGQLVVVETPTAPRTVRFLQAARDVEAAANITLLDSVLNSFQVEFQSRAKAPFEIASVRLEFRVFDQYGGTLLGTQPNNPYASSSSSSPYLTEIACDATACTYLSEFTNLSTACDNFWEFALIGTLQCRTVSMSVHNNSIATRSACQQLASQMAGY
jgi:hypothetical protein